MSSCCNNGCNCGAGCGCNGCGCCKMYPDEVETTPMATFLVANASHKASSGGSEMAAESGGCGCKTCNCGTSCSGCSCCSCN
ncbi:hypothetical protein ACP4OV_011289 [Aristida adscensionis]